MSDLQVTQVCECLVRTRVVPRRISCAGGVLFPPKIHWRCSEEDAHFLNCQISFIRCARAECGLVAAKERECRRSVAFEKAGTGDSKNMTEYGSLMNDAFAGCDAVSHVTVLHLLLIIRTTLTTHIVRSGRRTRANALAKLSFDTSIREPPGTCVPL